MGTIERKATGTETLVLKDCPCCGGDIDVGDCGYSSFNPGWADCRGSCKREWDLGYVDNAWQAGEAWNQKASEIRQRLRAMSLIKVNRPHSITRDFSREALEEEAQGLLVELESIVIGAKKKEQRP